MIRAFVPALACLALAASGCASVARSAHEGDMAAVRDYLAKGGSPAARFDGGGCDGCTLLHAAADGGQLEVARLLLDSGSDANAPGGHGRTPLHYAAGGQSAAVARLLLERGANPSLAVRDEWGSTPLLVAVASVPRKETTVLIPAGAVIGGRAPGEPDPDLIAALLEAGADVSAPTPKGNTPLHIAGYKGYAGVVRLLLARGARRDARNGDGETPAALAQRYHQDAVVALLRAP